ncbi:FecR family protein [Sphingobacterium griseoflavum]|uniref:FecR protein domain-containing protein n=1 Tax=Sphingobacterium griseoflavum TaxID=1474952 RepID=A0ABQ3HSD0_9SPHI|nr:FecR domain-containing protein [Sphingobacterium griseoflavum]GHE29813.1 hypothetical protein GCM10017764_11060 [Sphingobacterium griseoflavum]
MQDRKQELETLIDRYLKGQLDTDEKRHMEQWMHELDIMDDQPSMLPRDKDLLKQRIDAQLLPEETATTGRNRLWQPLAIAASLALFLFLGLQLIHQHAALTTPSPLRPDNSWAAAYPKQQTIRNHSGKDSILTLQDGTRVRLTANSSLTWKVPFESHRRAVTLEGTAYFEVAHNHKRPFSVRAGEIITTALGTSFWVEQTKAGGNPRVRLVTGKVSIAQLQDKAQPLILAYLTPGQQWQEPTVSKKTEAPAISKETAPADEPMVTTLFFHHKPLSEVLPALASFYSTSIAFSEKELEGMSFYGSFDQQNSIEQILTTICMANDLEMEWNAQQNTYTIRSTN